MCALGHLRAAGPLWEGQSKEGWVKWAASEITPRDLQGAGGLED